jgi:hypothetical protein
VAFDDLIHINAQSGSQVSPSDRGDKGEGGGGEIANLRGGSGTDLDIRHTKKRSSFIIISRVTRFWTRSMLIKMGFVNTTPSHPNIFQFYS